MIDKLNAAALPFTSCTSPARKMGSCLESKVPVLCPGCALTAAITEVASDLKDYEHTLQLIRNSDARGIRMWQSRNPEHLKHPELTWPDRGKMIFWLLERNKELEDLNRAHVHMTARVGGYPIDEYNNCAECGGGAEGGIPHDKSCKHYEADGS